MEENYKEKIKKCTEELMCNIVDSGVRQDNVDYLYKLVDIHKDICNEEYWEEKEENMKYRNYNGMYEGDYGRRRRDSRGRYRGENNLNTMSDMYREYKDYSAYGNENEKLDSLEMMLKSAEDFMKHLEEEATSGEEVAMIKESARRMIKN